MANGERLRAVMNEVDRLAQNPRRMEGWRQGQWNARPYRIDGDRNRYSVEALWDAGGESLSYREMTTKAGKPIKCKTAGCFAGWAVAMYAPPGSIVDEGEITLPGGEEVSLAVYAMELLGLETSKGWELFEGGNSLQTLHELVDEYTKEEGK